VARGRRGRDEVIAGVAWPAEPAGTDPRILDGLRDWLHARPAGGVVAVRDAAVRRRRPRLAGVPDGVAWEFVIPPG
jgi:hypothetical protein